MYKNELWFKKLTVSPITAFKNYICNSQLKGLAWCSLDHRLALQSWALSASSGGCWWHWLLPLLQTAQTAQSEEELAKQGIIIKTIILYYGNISFWGEPLLHNIDCCIRTSQLSREVYTYIHSSNPHNTFTFATTWLRVRAVTVAAPVAATYGTRICLEQ